MFEELAGGGAAFIAYATGYFPNREASRRVILAMLESGADAVEIGVPFSDPVMDGPVIQATSSAALEVGATPGGVLELASDVRARTDKPVMLMTYYNPIHKYGLGRFARDAAASGVDGVVIPDLPVEEMGPWKTASDDAGLETVAFCAQTTSDPRIELAGRMADGFLYCVSLLGTTGARAEVSAELPGFLGRVRRHAGCPLAVGLGVSTPEQCARIARIADGVIVGSALMEAVASGADLAGLEDLVGRMAGSMGQ
jgi:tryptophan synthase alpha chain